VVAYEDAAEGTMLQEGRGGRFSEVVLRPRVIVAAGGDLARAEALHGDANATCFIANSVNFPVRHEAEITVADEGAGSTAAREPAE
jgi:organic hydroperoxide reductase OsmC/OhrA